LQPAYKATSRSRWLKRKQKGSEDERITGSPVTVNGISSEILYLLDPAQGLCMPQGNTLRSIMASFAKRPGVGAPFALHNMSVRQPVRP